jgi:XTP/dITP diphosphohydrolase/tetrapyrrole methylase family protein/MazG family protein
MSKTAAEELVATVARLRAPGGCPWDREQTHKSLCECLVEETAELLETIDAGDVAHMREELGDLLLQVVMHAQMEAELGNFSFEDVAREVNEKMIRRHPHVFGDAKVDDTAGVLRQWEEIKKAEKEGANDGNALFKPTPPALTALLKARETWKTVKKKKLVVPVELVDAGAIAARAETLDEDAAGSALFALVAACREAGIDPESALRRHTARVMQQASSPQG